MIIKTKFDSSRRCRLFHDWWTQFKHVNKEGSATYKECLKCGSRRVKVEGEVTEDMIDIEWGCGVIKDMKFFKIGDKK